MEKKTNYLGEPYGIFYTKEEEYRMRLELAARLRDTIVKHLGKERVTCSIHSSLDNPDVKFEVYYKDFILYVNVLCSVYIEVKEYVPNMKDNSYSYYETDETIEKFILDTISFNLTNF